MPGSLSAGSLALGATRWQTALRVVLPQILPVEDAEIAGFARKQFEKQGIKIMSGAKVTKLEKGADSVTATIEAGGKSEQLTVDRVISAVGVQVTLVDPGGRLLPSTDAEVAGALADVMTAQGARLLLDRRVGEVRREGDPVAGRDLEVERCQCRPVAVVLGEAEGTQRDPGCVRARHGCG